MVERRSKVVEAVYVVLFAEVLWMAVVEKSWL